MREDVPDRVWLKRLVDNPRAWWLDKGIRTFVTNEYIWLIRYTRQGFPLSSSVVDLFWCDREQALAVIEGEMESMLRKREERRVLGDEATGTNDPQWEKTYPNLWEFVTAGRYSDGSPRVQGSLLIFFQDGQVKGMLRDKDQGLCLWATAKGCSQLLELIETMLDDPEAEWRIDRQAEGDKAKRRKPQR